MVGIATVGGTATVLHDVESMSDSELDVPALTGPKRGY